MNKNLKNIIILFVIILMAFAGYYMYSQQGINELSFESGSSFDQSIITNTEIFIKRRAALESINLDISVLENPIFLSLQDYTSGVASLPTGRENPFEEREDVEAIELDLEN
jgi:hypothetical protein